MKPVEQKVELRVKAMAALSAFPVTAEQSAAISARVLAHPSFASARNVALFVALPGEPDSSAFWLAAAGRTVVCPGMGASGPELRGAPSLASMARTRRGFSEPPAGPAVDPEGVDLWIVPGLSFDEHGVRLGRGGGYYDRLLARRRPDSMAIGVLPEQLFTAVPLPREPHDAAMDAIATEARWIVARSGV